jgi:hypothetical protein
MEPQKRHPGSDELRAGTRFLKEPDTDSAVVWQQPGGEQLVTVHDESLHGICLVMRDIATFKVGVTATIVYHADVLDGTVRRIEQLPDGMFLVAFACLPGRSDRHLSVPVAATT